MKKLLYDRLNSIWYLIEGDYANAATSAVAAFLLLGSLIGNEIKVGSRIVGNAEALIHSGGQALESAGNLYDSYVKDGEVISWKNTTDLITLGLSVAGMGMAGKSLAKDGKALKAVSQGNVNVKPAAVSNSTASSRADGIDLQKFTSEDKRNMAGIVTGGENLVDVSKMMRGKEGNIGIIPKEIADNLRGKEFANFKAFREEFWKVVARSSYASEFSPNNIGRMKKGLAPRVVKTQQNGKEFKGLSARP